MDVTVVVEEGIIMTPCNRCNGFMMLGYCVDSESGIHCTYDYCLNCGNMVFHPIPKRAERVEVKGKRRSKQQILLEEVSHG